MHLGFVEITLNSFHFHGTCLFSPIISSITLCKRPFYLLKKSNISLGLQLILCPTTERISTEFARASLKNCEIMDPTHVNYTLCSDQKLHFTSYSEISKCYWGGGAHSRQSAAPPTSFPTSWNQSLFPPCSHIFRTNVLRYPLHRAIKSDGHWT